MSFAPYAVPFPRTSVRSQPGTRSRPQVMPNGFGVPNRRFGELGAHSPQAVIAREAPACCASSSLSSAATSNVRFAQQQLVKAINYLIARKLDLRLPT